MEKQRQITKSQLTQQRFEPQVLAQTKATNYNHINTKNRN